MCVAAWASRLSSFCGHSGVAHVPGRASGRPLHHAGCSARTSPSELSGFASHDASACPPRPHRLCETPAVLVPHVLGYVGALWHIPKVLKDWRKGIDMKGGDLKAQQDEATDLVARFFADGDAAGNAAKAKTVTSPKGELLSNRDSLIALDKSLRSVGLSLAAFAYSLQLRPLKPGGRRYPLEKKVWTEEMQSSIDRDRRACVVDERGKRRLEQGAM